MGVGRGDSPTVHPQHGSPLLRQRFGGLGQSPRRGVRSGAAQHLGGRTAAFEQHVGAAQPRPRLRIHGRHVGGRPPCHGQRPDGLFQRLPQYGTPESAGAQGGHRRGDQLDGIQSEIHPRNDERRSEQHGNLRRDLPQYLRLERHEAFGHRPAHLEQIL